MSIPALCTLSFDGVGNMSPRGIRGLIWALLFVGGVHGLQLQPHRRPAMGLLAPECSPDTAGLQTYTECVRLCEAPGPISGTTSVQFLEVNVTGATPATSVLAFFSRAFSVSTEQPLPVASSGHRTGRVSSLLSLFSRAFSGSADAAVPEVTSAPSATQLKCQHVSPVRSEDQMQPRNNTRDLLKNKVKTLRDKMRNLEVRTSKTYADLSLLLDKERERHALDLSASPKRGSSFWSGESSTYGGDDFSLPRDSDATDCTPSTRTKSYSLDEHILADLDRISSGEERNGILGEEDARGSEHDEGTRSRIAGPIHNQHSGASRRPEGSNKVDWLVAKLVLAVMFLRSNSLSSGMTGTVGTARGANESRDEDGHARARAEIDVTSRLDKASLPGAAFAPSASAEETQPSWRGVVGAMGEQPDVLNSLAFKAWLWVSRLNPRILPV